MTSEFDEDVLQFAEGVVALEGEGCPHLSCDGLAGMPHNVMVCMACSRLIETHKQGQFTVMTLLDADGVKALFERLASKEDR